MKISKGLSLILLIFLMLSPIVYMAPTGTIEGFTTDEQGKPLANVKITLINQETGYIREIRSNSKGFYRAKLLPLGLYDMVAELEGYGIFERKGFRLHVGEILKMDVKLPVVTHKEVVTVTGEAPLIEFANPSSTTVVNEKAIETLPLNGRNFTDHLRLTSIAVARDDDYRIHVGGQRAITNSILMDGVDNNSAFFGEQRGGTRPPFTFSQNAVKEFQILETNFSAEYGRAIGAVINAVTKSGTNKFEGSAFWYYRNENLVSRDTFGRDYDDFVQHQFGFSIGGPIKRDKAFFFFNWDQQEKNKPLWVNIRAEELEYMNGKFNSTEDEYTLLLKLDFILNSNNRLSVRHNYTHFDALNGTVGGGSRAISNNGHEKDATNSFAVNWTSILSNRSFNELRVQISREQRPRYANDTSMPETYIAGVATFGQNNYLPNGLDEDLIQIMDNFNYTTESHDIKFGIDLNFMRIKDWFCRYCGGAYEFDTYEDFLNGFPSEYTQAFDITGNNGRITYRTGDYGAYIQDTWQVKPNLTINMGLRYDFQDQPQPEIWNEKFPQTKEIPEDWNNFGPRFAVSWDPWSKGKTVFKLGAGIYYTRTPSLLVANALLNNGARIVRISVGPYSEYMPDWPNRWEEMPEGEEPIKPDIYVFAKDFENPQTLKISLSAEHQLSDDLAVGIVYSYAHTTKLERRRDINLPPPAYQDEEGRWMFTGERINDDFYRIIQFESTAQSIYNGVTLKVNKRFSKGFQVMASYTWSKSMDDDSNERSVSTAWGYAENQYRMDREWGPSDWDVRHRAVISGTFDLPWGVTASIIGVYQSGKPFTPTTGYDSNHDGYKSDRPIGIGRNSYRQPPFKTVDFRISKSFQIYKHHELEFLVEGFNIFNWPNMRISYYNQVWGRPNFNEPNVAGRPFQLQLGMRYKFY